ncbi:Lar family restriction alleviation protein [Ochrobactrum sp. Sa2BUA5]|nr:Lar family restriction alleviation protein [Ochrobactrum gallinarum]
MQTLKPCPFCGPGESVVECYTDDYGYWKVGCGRCGSHSGTRPQSDPDAKSKIISTWNTRPAAPVEGLERYGYDRKGEVVLFENGAFVLYSQSEAIIAAERAEKESVERIRDFWFNTAHSLSEQIEKLEADNAALTARVKGMEESAKNSGVCMTCLTGSPDTYGCSDCLNTGWDGGCPPNSPEDIKTLFSGMISDFSKIKSRAEALETQLAAARKALRNIAEDEGAPFRIKVHALATLEITHDPH